MGHLCARRVRLAATPTADHSRGLNPQPPPFGRANPPIKSEDHLLPPSAFAKSYGGHVAKGYGGQARSFDKLRMRGEGSRCGSGLPLSPSLPRTRLRQGYAGQEGERARCGNFGAAGYSRPEPSTAVWQSQSSDQVGGPPSPGFGRRCRCGPGSLPIRCGAVSGQ